MEVETREEFLSQKDIIPNLPTFNKCTLERPNNILKNCNNPIGHNFGDAFVDGIITGDGPVVIHSGRIKAFWY